MDNIWGFPSYAWREAWADRSLKPLVTVATEPLVTDYFTPRAGQVYDSVDREVARIGWADLVHGGLARVVRRRTGGGYFVLVAPAVGEGRGPMADSLRALRCDHVHLAVGYPGRPPAPRPPGLPGRPPRPRPPGAQRLRAARARLRRGAATSDHRARAGQRHRRLPGGRAAARRRRARTGPAPRSSTSSAPTWTARRVVARGSVGPGGTATPTRPSTSPRRPGAVSSATGSSPRPARTAATCWVAWAGRTPPPGGPGGASSGAWPPPATT